MRARRQLLRGFRVGGICAAVLVLTVPSASATVFDNSTATAVDVFSDFASDTMILSCSLGGNVHLEPGGTDLLPLCNQTTRITVSGNDGNDAIDLSALQAGAFPQLTEVNLSSGFGSGTIKGSFFGDAITAGSSTVIQGLGGDDRIEGGGTILAGEGNDTVTSPQGSVDLGPGDDRLVSPSAGPLTGGPGEDILAWDLSSAGAADINFAVSDAVLHIDAPVPPTVFDIPSTQFEIYDLTLLPGGTQEFSSAGFSGSVHVSGLGGVDKIVAGPGDDFLEGGAGNDELTGGGGSDFLKGGTGDDKVFVRDGVVDIVGCGDGTDTVVADAVDVLTGCESVQLPPTPPPPPPPPPPAPPVVPATGAVKGPKSVVQGDKAKFTFASPTAGATFQCKLDKLAWKACKSPYKVATTKLKASADGVKHVLRVRAVLAGVVDATPAKKTFKVKKQ